ncbi:MAG: sulfite exporter TauE/SafE family protein [Candidatus Aminicenantes bacterium]|nr:sulfite exporter TauE/SafE family protein [Candidatus Aminicenantes bacterium]
MDLHILFFVLVGFVTQLIDGALGMAYGVSSNTFLLSIGVPPASASASVHLAECMTTAVSGLSHWRLGNVDWQLIKRLAVPGVLAAPLAAVAARKLPTRILMVLVGALIIGLSVRTILLTLR